MPKKISLFVNNSRFVNKKYLFVLIVLLVFVPSLIFAADNPVLIQASHAPDPQIGGLEITFSSVASGANSGDVIKLYICDNVGCLNCGPGNVSGCHAVSEGWSSQNPSASYTCPSDGCIHDYWAKVCDQNGHCSGLGPSFLSHIYGGNNFDIFYSTYVDGNYVYAVGQTDSEGQGLGAALIVKFNKADLSIAARRTYSGSQICSDPYCYDRTDSFRSVYVDGDHVYAVGYTGSEAFAAIGDALIVKFNKADLSIAARRAYGGNANDGDEHFHSVYVDGDHVYAVGEVNYWLGHAVGYSWNALIVKFNKSNLSVAAHKIYGGGDERHDVFHSVYVDNNHVYAVGYTYSEGGSGGVALIVKFNKVDLSIAVRKIYGGDSGSDWFLSVDGDNDYVYVVGRLGSEYTNAALIKFNKADLSIAARRGYGHSSLPSDIAYKKFWSVYVDSNYVYAAGHTHVGRNDGLLVKFNKADLSVVGEKFYGGNGFESFRSVYVDGSYIYAAGITSSSGDQYDDAFLVKFDINLPPGTCDSSPPGFTIEDSHLALVATNLPFTDSNLSLSNSPSPLANITLSLANSNLTSSFYQEEEGCLFHPHKNFTCTAAETTISTVTTQAATGITTDSATLNMDYTVGDYSPVEVRFRWKKTTDAVWINTGWVSRAANGSHSEMLSGLDVNTEYEFKAQLRYNGTEIEGDVLIFTTQSGPLPEGCAPGETAVEKTIHKGNDGNAIPFFGGIWDAMRFQTLYLQSEIDQAGYLDKIYFQKLDSSAGTFNNFRIYLCHTSLSNIGTNFANNCIDAPVEVMNVPSIHISGNAGDWFEFNIGQDFTYNNTDNLIVEIRWNGDDGNNIPLRSSFTGEINWRLFTNNDSSANGNRDVTAYNFRALICAQGPEESPTVTTEAATGITTDSATLNMSYTIGDYSQVDVRFSWKKTADAEWSTTGWTEKTASGTYSDSESLIGLAPDTVYEFYAQLRYDGTVIDGNTLDFTTSSVAPPPGTCQVHNVWGWAWAANELAFSCGDPVIFNYKGEQVTYWTVESQGQCWMDRNLGASQVATAHNNLAAYGDLFQWGRLDDGHQNRASGTTAILSNIDNPGHSDFISVEDPPYDWRSPQKNSLWQGTSGINNPCPSGWRIPTIEEWETEQASWSSDDYNGAFSSPLKLPAAGLRFYGNGSIGEVGSSGNYWSSTVDGNSSLGLGFGIDGAGMGPGFRAFGSSVRCINEATTGVGGIGWISFSCRNCDSDGDGLTDQGHYSQCPVGESTHNYGVDIDPATGILSGNAWSEHIGWLSFNKTETGPPPGAPIFGDHLAEVNLDNGEVSGWARFLAACDSVPCTSPAACVNCGGWDGWIKLRDVSWPAVWIDSSNYEDLGYSEFRKWAWGSDVVGWISFNTDNHAGGEDYKVMTDFSFFIPPDSPQAIIGCAVTEDDCGGPGCKCDASDEWVAYQNNFFDILNQSQFPNSGTQYTSVWFHDHDVDPFYECTGLGEEARCHFGNIAGLSESTYNIELEVEDEYGSLSVANQRVVVKSDIEARFKCSDDGLSYKNCADVFPLEDETVYFTAEDSIPSGGATIDNWSWFWKEEGGFFTSFGGNAETVSRSFDSGIDKVIIRLEVRDNAGREDETEETLSFFTEPRRLPKYREVKPTF